MISEFEKQRRAEGYEYAKASVGFEGGYVSEAFDKQCQKYINGDIELDDLDKYIEIHTEQQ